MGLSRDERLKRRRALRDATTTKARVESLDAGYSAGRANYGREVLFENVVENCLDGVLNEAYDEATRERSGNYLLGFARAWGEMEAVQPYKFLTKAQTIRVQSYPRRARERWLELYRQGMRDWTKNGGRPVLPEIV